MIGVREDGRDDCALERRDCEGVTWTGEGKRQHHTRLTRCRESLTEIERFGPALSPVSLPLLSSDDAASPASLSYEPATPSSLLSYV